LTPFPPRKTPKKRTPFAFFLLASPAQATSPKGGFGLGKGPPPPPPQHPRVSPLKKKKTKKVGQQATLTGLVQNNQKSNPRPPPRGGGFSNFFNPPTKQPKKKTITPPPPFFPFTQSTQNSPNRRGPPTHSPELEIWCPQKKRPGFARSRGESPPNTPPPPPTTHTPPKSNIPTQPPPPWFPFRAPIFEKRWPLSKNKTNPPTFFGPTPRPLKKNIYRQKKNRSGKLGKKKEFLQSKKTEKSFAGKTPRPPSTWANPDQKREKFDHPFFEREKKRGGWAPPTLPPVNNCRPPNLLGVAEPSGSGKGAPPPPPPPQTIECYSTRPKGECPIIFFFVTAGI